MTSFFQDGGHEAISRKSPRIRRHGAARILFQVAYKTIGLTDNKLVNTTETCCGRGIYSPADKDLLD